MTTIKLKNGSGAPTAGDLAQGEPALDLTNKRLYTEDSGGTVIEVGTNPGTDVTFADNRKAIFGAGSDLQIYHDANDSYISDQGSGNLKLLTDEFRLRNAADSAHMLTGSQGGAITAYHNGNAKLATTSTGIDVTGTAVTDGLTSAGDAAITGSSSGSTVLTLTSNALADTPLMVFQRTGGAVAGKLAYEDSNTAMSFGTTTAHELKLLTSNTERLQIDSSGNFIFNELSADADFRVESNGNANMLFVDAGNDHVNIGTSTDYGGSLNVNKKLVVKALDGESANDYVASFQNQEATNSQSFGLSIAAGSTSSDIALNVVDHDASNVLLRVLGDGATTIGGAATFSSSITTTDLEIEAATPVLEIDSTTSANLATLQFTTAGTVDSKITHQASSGDMVIESGRNSTWGGKIYLKTDTFQNAVFTRTTSTFNENSADMDFRVESDNQANMLIVDASADKVGIGGSAGDTTLTVRGSNNSAGDLYTVVGAGNTPGIVVQNAGTTDNNNAAVFFKNDAAVVASVGARFVSHSTEETELRFSTTNSSGTTRERVTISGEGNVGIGTTDGDVTSDGNASRTYVGIIGSGNRGRLNIGSTAANGADGGAISFVNGANELGALYNDANSGSQTVGTMYLTSTGALDVRATGGAVFNESSVDADFRVESNSNFAAFFVDAGNSRVGINQDVPTEALDIVGNVKVGSLLKVEDIIAKSSTGLNLQTDEGTKRIIVEDSGGVIVNETSADCDFRVESNNNAYMLRVDGGNDRVAIGTNAPQETLEVRGGSTSAIRVSGGSNTAHRIQIGYDNTDGPYVRAGSSGVTKLQFYVDSTTLAAEIASNGDFYTNDGTVHSLSDIRVKTDVEDLADGLDLVKQLRPRTFKYTEDSEFYSESTKDEVRYGFVANEVEAVAPQYTDTGKGKIGGVEVDDLKSLSTTKMIPMLVKAIQEQSEIIDDLRARVAQLESN